MSKISFEELKQRFPDIQDIKPYGFVVVVPGNKFRPEWEFYLKEQGYKVHMTELDRKAVVLVSCVKAVEANEGKEREVYSPPPPVGPKSEPKPEQNFGDWTPEQDERLLKRMEELEGSLASKCLLLRKEFGKSQGAVYQRYWKLTHTPAGKIERKRNPKRQGKTVDVCPGCGLPKDLCACDEEKKEQQRVAAKEAQNSYKVANGEKVAEGENVTKKLVDTVCVLAEVVDKLGCQAIMHSLEIKELRDKEFKIPVGLWTSYANVMLEDGKEHRDLFRLKAKKLLEVYA